MAARLVGQMSIKINWISISIPLLVLVWHTCMDQSHTSTILIHLSVVNGSSLRISPVPTWKSVAWNGARSNYSNTAQNINLISVFIYWFVDVVSMVIWLGANWLHRLLSRAWRQNTSSETGRDRLARIVYSGSQAGSRLTTVKRISIVRYNCIVTRNVLCITPQVKQVLPLIYCSINICFYRLLNCNSF